MKRKLAPDWVMMGILALTILTALSPAMEALGLITPETVTYDETFVGSITLSVLRGWWIVPAISLLFYSSTAVFSVLERWKTTALAGAILLALCFGINIWLTDTLYSISSYQEYTDLSAWHSFAVHINGILFAAGSLLIGWSCAVSKTVRILFTVLVGVTCLLIFVYPGQTVYIAWACAVKPVFAAVIICSCFASKPSHSVVSA